MLFVAAVRRSCCRLRGDSAGSAAAAEPEQSFSRRWRRLSVTAATCCWCWASSPAASSSPSSPRICRPIWSTAAAGSIGGWMIAVIGLFNIIGSLGVGGYLDQDAQALHPVGDLLQPRAVAIVAFISTADERRSPRSSFGVVIGLTVALDDAADLGLVALMFGTRWLAMLLRLRVLQPSGRRLSRRLARRRGVRAHRFLRRRSGGCRCCSACCPPLINLPIVEKPRCRRAGCAACIMR